MIVKISSKEPADVIPQIGFNACYKDVVGSPDKCLAFAIIQSCAASANVAYGTTDATGGATTSGASGTMVGTGQSYGAATQTQGSQGAAQAQGYGQSYGAATQTQASQAASQTSRAAAGALSFPFCTTVRVIWLLQPHVRAFMQCEYPMEDRWCLHHKNSVMEMLCGRTDTLCLCFMQHTRPLDPQTARSCRARTRDASFWNEGASLVCHVSSSTLKDPKNNSHSQGVLRQPTLASLMPPLRASAVGTLLY